VAQSEFADRFLDSTYADDEPVHIFIPRGTDRWVPERLWWRLVGLGRAYEVHLLPLLPGATDPQFLNAQQVATLVDEVQFVADVVDDDLIAGLVAELVPLLVEAQLQPDEHALGIEGA
jgi:hypothetical protein